MTITADGQNTVEKHRKYPESRKRGLMKPWQPGQSGNPGGRPRTKPISDRYTYIAEVKLPESIQKKLKLEPGATYGDAVAVRTFHAALEGDIAATREIREAIEGKSTIRTDDEQPPIRIDISAIPKFRERA